MMFNMCYDSMCYTVCWNSLVVVSMSACNQQLSNQIKNNSKAFWQYLLSLNIYVDDIDTDILYVLFSSLFQEKKGCI